MLSACHEPADLGSGSSALIVPATAGACPGQQDKIVTTDYFGAAPSDYTSPLTAADVTRAAAVEWAYSSPFICYPTPCYGKAAVAFVAKSTNRISVRLYDTALKQFYAERNFRYSSSRGWIKRMGNDRQCVMLGGGQCAWFAYQSFSYSDYVAILAVNESSGFGAWFVSYGQEPSGEHGIVNGDSRKMVAYITLDRSQVRAAFFDSWLNLLSDVLIRSVPYPAQAYQTESAWHEADQRWLVAWTEVDTQSTHMARVMQRTISWDYQLGPAPSPCNPSPCDPAIVCMRAGEECGGLSLKEAGPLWGTTCGCKGLYVAASNFSSDTNDRYRMFVYGGDNLAGDVNFVRLSSLGVMVEGVSEDIVSGTWSPMTQMRPVGGNEIFQRLVGNPPSSSSLQYFPQGSLSMLPQGDVISAKAAEDFRAQPLGVYGVGAYVAVGIATDREKIEAEPGTLKLSVVPLGQPSICPP